MVLGLLCLSTGTQAQNEVDALRYSRLNVLGSARYFGAGGAFGSLGADLTTLSVNPAGLGLYRRSDTGLSLYFGSASNEAIQNNTLRENSQSLFGIANAGAIASYPIGTSMERFNMGVSFNRMADFNERIDIEGNFNGTMSEVFALQANGIPSGDLSSAFPFGAGLAWETYLIDPIANTENQYFAVASGEAIRHENYITRTGGMNETALSLAGNIENRLYFGFTLGIPSIRFEEVNSYSETVIDEASDLESWSMVNRLETSGSGINLKAGVIFRPVEYIRLGAAIHSPTWMSLSDDFTTSMETRFRNGDEFFWDSPLGQYNYRLRTPARYLLSANVLVGKKGFLSADYELVDYSTSKLKEARIGGDGYDFDIENGTITEAYRAASNFRLGAEVRPQDWLTLRGGIRYELSAYTTEASPDATPRKTYSAGVGLRFRGFYLDLAGGLQSDNEDYFQYDPQLAPVARIDKTTVFTTVSVGLRY